MVQDWLASETRFVLSAAERGIYREALDICYTEGSIPADKRILAKVLAVTAEELETAWPAVSQKFQPAPGNPSRLVNLRALELGREARERLHKQREGGRKGGRKTRRKPYETNEMEGTYKGTSSTRARDITSHHITSKNKKDSEGVDPATSPRGAIPFSNTRDSTVGNSGGWSPTEYELEAFSKVAEANIGKPIDPAYANEILGMAARGSRPATSYADFAHHCFEACGNATRPPASHGFWWEITRERFAPEVSKRRRRGEGGLTPLQQMDFLKQRAACERQRKVKP